MRINRTITFSLFICIAIFSCKTKQGLNVRSSNENSQPNILLIHVDDLGFHDLSIYGSQIYQTPNIDKLAGESIQFTKAYSNYPRCVPSRFAMITGHYPVQYGDVPDDGFEISELPYKKNAIKQIRDNGYQTAYFGKWHLGSEESLKQVGFQQTYAAGHAGSPRGYFYPFNAINKPWHEKKDPIPDLDDNSKEGDFLTNRLTDEVISYIKNAEKGKPFMTMLSFYAVHEPLEAPEPGVKANQTEIDGHDFGNTPEFIEEGTGRTKMRQNHATYAAMVENMDENIGRLLATLEELKIEENTIVVFSSDHGGLSNDGTRQRDLATSNAPLRAGKGWLYDGGLKVPLLMKWQGKFQPRIEDESLVMLMDVFPTLLDVTANKTTDTDGLSLKQVINNKESLADRTVFWHSSRARPQSTGDTKSSAIRKGDFKLINWYEDERVELYNMKDDISESNDISNSEKDKAALLLQELNEWKNSF